MCKSLRPILTILAVFLTANLWAQSVKWTSSVEPLEGDTVVVESDRARGVRLRVA